MIKFPVVSQPDLTISTMFQKKHIFPIPIAALAMFGLSYFWHSIFLNDFNRILIPKNVFFSMLGAAYLCISAAMMVFFTAKIINIKAVYVKGFLVGMMGGITVYLVAITIGYSFNNSMVLKQSIIDAIWQMLEQGIGGVVMAWVYRITERGFIFFAV
jgi:hypothetical protein